MVGKDYCVPNSLRNLPVGSYIKLKAPFDMKIYKKGERMILIKERKKFDKRSYWTDGRYYYPSKIIGHEYEVIKKGK